MLLLVLHGWLTQQEEHSLRVFEIVVLRRIIGPKREEETGWRRKCMMSSFIICVLCRILLGWPNQGGWMCRTCSLHGERIKEIEMYGTSSMHDETCIQNFS